MSIVSAEIASRIYRVCLGCSQVEWVDVLVGEFEPEEGDAFKMEEIPLVLRCGCGQTWPKWREPSAEPRF